MLFVSDLSHNREMHSVDKGIGALLAGDTALSDRDQVRVLLQIHGSSRIGVRAKTTRKAERDGHCPRHRDSWPTAGAIESRCGHAGSTKGGG